jgi:predicted alpha/beta hydrolase family esterase
MPPPTPLPLPPIYLLPGWLDSGPDHWQTLGSPAGDRRVVQDDWQWPRRGDWMARLDETLLDAPRTPVLLAAHSLGCLLVAAWADAQPAHRAGCRCPAGGAAGHRAGRHAAPAARLAAPSARRCRSRRIVVISSDDPYADATRTRALARRLGRAGGRGRCAPAT